MKFNLDYSYCEHLQYKMCVGHVVRGFNPPQADDLKRSHYCSVTLVSAGSRRLQPASYRNLKVAATVCILFKNLCHRALHYEYE